jgi:hypothetical protein
MALMSGFVLVGLNGSAAETEAPDVITLQSELWSEHTKSPVTFSHNKHSREYGVKCTDCHHVYRDGKNTFKEGDKVQKCMECHNEPTIKGEKKLPEDKQQLNLKLAYHNNCQGCHRVLKQKDRAKYGKIPTTCIKCHPKEEEK